MKYMFLVLAAVIGLLTPAAAQVAPPTISHCLQLRAESAELIHCIRTVEERAVAALRGQPRPTWCAPQSRQSFLDELASPGTTRTGLASSAVTAKICRLAGY